MGRPPGPWFKDERKTRPPKVKENIVTKRKSESLKHSDVEDSLNEAFNAPRIVRDRRNSFNSW